MSTSVNSLDKTLGGATENDATGQQRKAADVLNNVASTVNDAVSKGVTAVKGQIQTVREQGFEGVRKDVTNYARTQPVKALLVAGGIGALIALIARRR
jgi:hypothetical protein